MTRTHSRIQKAHEQCDKRQTWVSVRWREIAADTEGTESGQSRDRSLEMKPQPYLAFEAAFFLRSAQCFFLSSDNLFRPAAVSLPPGFLLAAFFVGKFLSGCLCRALEFAPIKMLRAEVSLAISTSSSCTILAVSI